MNIILLNKRQRLWFQIYLISTYIIYLRENVIFDNCVLLLFRNLPSQMIQKRQVLPHKRTKKPVAWEKFHLNPQKRNKIKRHSITYSHIWHIIYQYIKLCVLIIYIFCESFVELCAIKHKCRLFLWIFPDIGQCPNRN